MSKKLTIMIRDDLDEEFRNAVFKKKGMHKGNLSEAIEEALEMWIDEQARSQGKKGNK
jgi:metal-responsive CopG/Arc/MetJ family transcriptional regulator